MEVEILQTEVVDTSSEVLVDEINQAYCAELGGVAIACSGCFFADQCPKISDDTDYVFEMGTQSDAVPIETSIDLRVEDLADISGSRTSTESQEVLPQPSKSRYLDRLMDDSINLVVADSLVAPITLKLEKKAVVVTEVISEIAKEILAPGVNIDPILVDEVKTYEPEETIPTKVVDIVEPEKIVIMEDNIDADAEIESEIEEKDIILTDSDTTIPPKVVENEIDKIALEEDNIVPTEAEEPENLSVRQIFQNISNKLVQDDVEYFELEHVTDDDPIETEIEVDAELELEDLPTCSGEFISDDEADEEVRLEDLPDFEIGSLVNDVRRSREATDSIDVEQLNVDWEPIIRDDNDQVFERQFIYSNSTLFVRDLVDLMRELARFALN